MLVISRKARETLIVDTGKEIIEIMITEVGKQVKMAIDAPKSCKIWRKEIYETMKENQEAVNVCSNESLQNFVAALKK